MFLNNPFTDAFGLDIGDLSIKLLQLQRHTAFRKQPMFVVKNSRSVSLPPGYIVNGELQQPEMVRKKLLQLLGKDGQQKPIRSTWVISDLPEPKTFLKLIEIETPPTQITGDDAIFHARRHLPYDIEETYMDWCVVNAADTRARVAQVLIGAAPKIIADSYTYLLHSVGLTPIAMEIEAIAIARAMITANKAYDGEARAILDLGATRSSLMIYDHNSIQFSTTLNFSGELVNTALIQELKLDYEQVENLKIKNGLAYDDQYPGYLKAVTGLTEGLIGEIKTAINFYKEHFSNTNPVTHITMCGGISNMKNIDNFISRKLKISAHPGHPWKNLFNPKFTETDNLNSRSMASAIGLALRAAKPILD
ncbi:MAG: hypothetical protein A2261_00880 [Candidatus Magasanikbacteria bacterium RIFOXYA2_FULL_44_8]|uniref:SHS2 domain-containing protein n=1 Tax=Candidatus Magasanikbacteria bacterium RIFOXYA2_FULL_44_8 TaxID=1798696 RepID=A0A1F6NJY4_9BACT|nr:MAG: hypothetical protein A2261_00880 [Candidatus Magasanikbacteria bacterium RIFOXYA2_FULL_44_8]